MQHSGGRVPLQARSPFHCCSHVLQATLCRRVVSAAAVELLLRTVSCVWGVAVFSSRSIVQCHLILTILKSHKRSIRAALLFGFSPCARLFTLHWHVGATHHPFRIDRSISKEGCCFLHCVCHRQSRQPLKFGVHATAHPRRWPRGGSPSRWLTTFGWHYSGSCYNRWCAPSSCALVVRPRRAPTLRCGDLRCGAP